MDSLKTEQKRKKFQNKTQKIAEYMCLCVKQKTASLLLHRVEIRSLLLTHYLKSFMVKWRSLSSLTTNKKKRRRETSSFQFSHSLILSLIPPICVSYFGKHFNNILRSLRWTRNTSIILIHYRISFAPITLPCTLFSNRVCVCEFVRSNFEKRMCLDASVGFSHFDMNLFDFSNKHIAYTKCGFVSIIDDRKRRKLMM